MQPVVVTSINPYHRLKHQKTCFNRWRELGFDIITYNCESEADDLVKAGVEPRNIVRIAPNQTGLRLHNVPSPLIKHVIQDIIQQNRADSVLLVNADIYPALRKNPNVFTMLSPCAALTRNEVTSLVHKSCFSRTPYRGGLDSFFFSMPALEKFYELIRTDSASERMAFGIPGWDFYIGGHIISPKLLGKILDAGFLLHASHRPTYSNVAELENYVETLESLNVISSCDPVKAAQDFARVINAQCAANADLSTVLSRMYQQHERRSLVDFSDIDQQTIEIIESLNLTLAPSQRVDSIAIAQLQCNEEITYFVLKEFFRGNSDVASGFISDLRALRLYLLHFHPRRSSNRALTSTYPQGNLHSKAIEKILELGNMYEVRLSSLDLFTSELFNHGIFNPRMLNYLCLACINTSERLILGEISRLLRNLYNESSS